MNTIEIICAIVLIVVALGIIVFTLQQQAKGNGLSGAITGDASGMMDAGRARSNDEKAAKLTKILGILFFAIALIVCLVSAHLS